jgi:hypothetical protein
MGEASTVDGSAPIEASTPIDAAAPPREAASPPPVICQLPSGVVECSFAGVLTIEFAFQSDGGFSSCDATHPPPLGATCSAGSRCVAINGATGNEAQGTCQ